MARASAHHVDQVLAIVGGLKKPPTDNIVRQSWLRSAKTHGVDPGSRETPRILTVSELRVSQDALSLLIDVARVELDQLYKIVRPTHYVILLCDKNGFVITHRGEESEAGQFRRWGTWLGGVWSEEVEGTNGIGTCLAEQRPVTVHRAQHFRARHIHMSCSGAPIFAGNGDLLGVLDVSSINPTLSEHAHALTGALTIASARAIEERLFRKQFRQNWIIAVRPPNDTRSAMLIAMDRDRRIAGTDRHARSVVSNSGNDRLAEGGSLWAVFEQNDALFRHTDRGDIVTELRPSGTAESWPAIITPPEPASARWSTLENEELRLRPRLDALAISRPIPQPSRTSGGLPPATLRRIREYVDSHLDRNIGLESLAATAELSLYHFARAFKQSEGTTPHAFVLERRLAKARELLTATDLPLSQIAFTAGFADQSHLARRFRQMVGVSPGQFRKLHD
ncbi:MAG TPA: helix-turn-helix domain-containing protein [Rhizomicrobium sp.]|jgi:AraC-like DNA-binding protein